MVIVLIITIETKLVTVPKVRTNDQHHQKYKVTLEGSHQERSIFSPSRTPLAGASKLGVPGVSEEKEVPPTGRSRHQSGVCASALSWIYLPTSGSLPRSSLSTLPVHPWSLKALTAVLCTALSPQVCAQGPCAGRWHIGPGEFVESAVVA